MKTTTYQRGLVAVTFLLIAVGVILGSTAFRFGVASILVYTGAGLLVLLAVSLLARNRVKGALADERSEVVAGKAAYIAFRVFVIVVFIGMAVLMVMKSEGTVGSGSAIGILGLSVGFISAVFSAAYFALDRGT